MHHSNPFNGEGEENETDVLMYILFSMQRKNPVERVDYCLSCCACVHDRHLLSFIFYLFIMMLGVGFWVLFLFVFPYFWPLLPLSNTEVKLVISVLIQKDKGMRRQVSEWKTSSPVHSKQEVQTRPLVCADPWGGGVDIFFPPEENSNKSST